MALCFELYTSIIIPSINFGDRSFLKKYHELVHLNNENGYNHLVYGLDDGFYTPF